jgi:hypothetical protein
MNDTNELFDAEIPAGVEDLLYCFHLPPEFDQRCKDATQAAYIIDCMRREMAAHQLSPLPFGRFVSALAEMAGVSLNIVLSSLGLSQVDALNAETAQPFARLARLLGLPRDRAQILLPMAYQAVKDPEAAGALLMAFRGVKRIPVEDGLRDWEDACPDEVRNELERIRRAIDNEYEELG